MENLTYESPLAVIYFIQYPDVIKTSGEGGGDSDPDLDLNPDEGWSGYH
jgi:hypothetical protein